MDKKEIVKKYKIKDYFLFVNFQNFEQGFHFPLKQKLKKEDKLLLFRDIILSFASQQNICSVNLKIWFYFKDKGFIEQVYNKSFFLQYSLEKKPSKLTYNFNLKVFKEEIKQLIF